LDPGKGLEFFRFERALNGAQAIRPFRMPERGEVIETRGVSD
jgi:hypothetical protein